MSHVPNKCKHYTNREPQKPRSGSDHYNNSMTRHFFPIFLSFLSGARENIISPLQVPKFELKQGELRNAMFNIVSGVYLFNVHYLSFLTPFHTIDHGQTVYRPCWKRGDHLRLAMRQCHAAHARTLQPQF